MLEVKPNLLDRLIAYVSPGTAARRMHARYCRYSDLFTER